MSTRRDRLRAHLVRRLYRVGWRVAAGLPDRLTDALIRGSSRLVRHQDGPHVRTLRRNLAVLTGRPVDDRLLERSLRSYLRMVVEVLALPGWSRRQVLDRVETIDETVLRAAYAGTGAVVALPHSGNWDLAGAWACTAGMPVTTVAEQLPDAEFADFVDFRSRLGMEVISHRSPQAIPDLVAAVRRGRLVCLLADRDLAGSGVPVQWSGRTVTMPAGPAVVARRSGAALLPAVCRYAGARMEIVFGTPIAARPGRDGLVAMTQEVADFFVATLSRRPEDWHMMQPFFAESGRA